MSKIILGDSSIRLRKFKDNSIDLVVTDPPYRYGFMGKDWDSIVSFLFIWHEVFRVLKPGGFAYIMNAPRSDCQLLLLDELKASGFDIRFSPIFWTYASGFPKSANMSKLIDKRLGVEQEVIGKYEHPGRKGRSYQTTSNVFSGDRKGDKIEDHNSIYSQVNRVDQRIKGEDGKLHLPITKPSSPEAKRFEGSYAGFQPKPAVELINVVMKPLSEKSYIDQALANGKGVSWFDDCRIPYTTELDGISTLKSIQELTPNDKVIVPFGQSKTAKENYKIAQINKEKRKEEILKLKKKLIGGRPNHHYSAGGENMGGLKPNDSDINLKGRFPANLLISDNILDSGKKTKSTGGKTHGLCKFNEGYNKLNKMEASGSGGYGDSGDFSRYFSLDTWYNEHLKNLPKELQDTFPFLYCPKPTKKEKNKGLTGKGKKVTDGRKAKVDQPSQRGETIRKNTHPTGKPIKLMAYLITLGSRPGDLILDPFAGSGTTGIACKLEDRQFIMIEKNEEYYEIMKARLKAHKTQRKLL